jgi:hypothetical protein
MSDPTTALRRAGSRDLLMCELRNIASGCLGSVDLRSAARDGAAELARGAASVQVRHVLYEVTDNVEKGVTT